MYIACGYTDLRKGIDGLAALVQSQFQLDPFTNTQRRFLFMNLRFIIYLSTISSYPTSITFPISFARSMQPLVKPVLAKR